MKKMSSEQIRKLWQNFWESFEKKHNFLTPAPLVPDFQDKTVLFTWSGMQQLIPNLVGKSHPLWDRLYNIQKCIRTVDIEEVWDHSHHTFFEMMWNWSLWNYFKEESIKYSIDFLINYLEIPIEKIAVTVFEGDEEVSFDEVSAKKWLEVGIPKHKISYLGKEENWWSPGPVGPCWPDSEIFFRIWPEKIPPEISNVKNDEDNWLEIWNNVFMEFYRDENWNFSKLKQKNVDTGMGLERICLIMQWVNTNYETDLFEGLLNVVWKYSWYNYFDIINTEKDKILWTNMRIIVDHIRAGIFMIADWVIPSNESRGYILRRLIRRMYYNFYLLNWEGLDQKNINNFVKDIVNSVENKYWNFRQEISLEKENIIDVLIKEIEQFKKTLNNWLKLLENILEEEKEKTLDWKKAFVLYDTYGFPFELTKEISYSKGFSINEKWFYEELEKAKEKSRKWAKDFFEKWIDWSVYLEWIPQTEFLWYEDLEVTSPELLKEINVDWKCVLIFDKTPFYPEWWWQNADTGEIEFENWQKKRVYDVQNYDWVFLHFVE